MCHLKAETRSSVNSQTGTQAFVDAPWLYVRPSMSPFSQRFGHVMRRHSSQHQKVALQVDSTQRTRAYENPMSSAQPTPGANRSVMSSSMAPQDPSSLPLTAYTWYISTVVKKTNEERYERRYFMEEPTPHKRYDATMIRTFVKYSLLRAISLSRLANNAACC